MSGRDDVIDQLVRLAQVQEGIEEMMGEPGQAGGTEMFSDEVYDEAPVEPMTAEEEAQADADANEIIAEFVDRGRRRWAAWNPEERRSVTDARIEAAPVAMNRMVQDQIRERFSGRSLTDPHLKTDIHAFLEANRPTFISGDWIKVEIDAATGTATIDVLIPEGVLVPDAIKFYLE